MRLSLSALLAASISSGGAAARPVPYTPPLHQVTRPSALATGDSPVVDPIRVKPPGTAFGNTPVLFLNRHGATLTPGAADDATANVIQPADIGGTGTTYTLGGTIPPFGGDDAAWQSLLGCMRRGYAPYDVTVVDSEPSPSTSYIEVIIGGQPSHIGVPNDVATGWGGGYCYPYDHSFAFAFSELIQPELLCKIVLQESAHALGLYDHLLLCGDAMTYLDLGTSSCAPGEHFVNQMASCGEYQERACVCGGTSKNSHAELLAMVGPASDQTPPIAQFARPQDNDEVDPGFAVEVTASDERGVLQVELLIDGATFATDLGAPWSFNAPTDLSAGPHILEVTASDGHNETTSSITVMIAGAAGDDSSGSMEGPGGGGGDEGGLGPTPYVWGGCSVSASARPTSAAVILLAGLLALFAARRRRRARRLLWLR